MIEGKVVKLGNSMAISVKKKDIEENNLKLNQKVKFSVINPQKSKALNEMFGMMRGAKPFKRDERDRSF